MSNDNRQEDLATQIREHHRSGEFDKALEISARCNEIQSTGLEGLSFPMGTDRLKCFHEEEAKKRVRPEIESVC